MLEEDKKAREAANEDLPEAEDEEDGTFMPSSIRLFARDLKFEQEIAELDFRQFESKSPREHQHTGSGRKQEAYKTDKKHIMDGFWEELKKAIWISIRVLKLILGL